MYDIKIIGGQIVDPTGRTLAAKDIGIKDGKIAAVGNNLEGARETFIADGKYVSAGFIDIHCHEESLALTEGKDLDISIALLRGGVTTAVGGNCGSNRNDFREFIQYVQAGNYPVNFMTYVGHNSLREKVGNEDIHAKSSKLQIEKMKALVEEAIEFGGIGLSYGLEYCPGIDEEEAVSVAERIHGRRDVLAAFHARYDSTRALVALAEIEDIAGAIRTPVQVSHLSSVCAYGNMREALVKIENMVKKGFDVMADAYPYNAFSCKIGSAVFEDGCFENWGKSFDSVMLAEAPYRGVFCNRELFYEVRQKYPKMYVVAVVMNEDEIKAAFKHPLVFAASDGGYNNHQGHPRGAGTFARVLGRYCLQDKLFDLHEAIHKMTVMPAKRLRIDNRKGKIQEGYDADLVIFDPSTIIDRATFEDPQTPPEGIEAVFVNGRMAVDKDLVTGEKAGEFIPRPDNALGASTGKKSFFQM